MKRRDELPVFLIGSMRSGSTLLRYLLDTHPRLACPPESKFISGLSELLDYPQLGRALHSMGCTFEETCGHLRTFIDGVLSGYARRENKARWIDKTPNYYRLIPFLEAVFSGEALYVVIVRHPLDTIVSLSEFLRLTEHHEDPDVARVARLYGTDLRAWARYWTEVYESIHIAREQAPERFLTVRYEELVRRPGTVLKGVLSFIGETYYKELVKLAFEVDHTTGYQDGKIRGTGGVHRDSIGRWRGWPAGLAEALWEIAAPTATRFGYRKAAAKRQLARGQP